MQDRPCGSGHHPSVPASHVPTKEPFCPEKRVFLACRPSGQGPLCSAPPPGLPEHTLRPARPCGRHSTHHPVLSGWYYCRPKRLLRFFHEIKDTVFIFTNNFSDLDVLSMSAVSRYGLLVGRGRGAAEHLPLPKTAPQQRIIWPKCQQYTKPRKLPLTRSIRHSTFSAHGRNLFSAFRLYIYLS